MYDELRAARGLARSVFGAVATLSFFACSSGTAPPPREIVAAPPPPAPPAESAAPVASAPTPAISPTELAMRDWLDSEGIYHDRFVRKTLYTWTTTAQASELRKTRTLLSKTGPAGGRVGRALFDVELDARSEPLAKVLRDPAFAKKRFAWANPWATSRGLWNESYGSELVRVTLRPGCLVLAFDPKAARALRVFQIDDGVEVGADVAVASPARIAAVYHVSVAFEPTTHESLPFREYALVNESMIESWEIGTPNIASDLEVNLEMLRTVKSAIARGRADHPVPSVASWATDVATNVWPKFSGPRQTLGGFEQAAERYAAALAFTTAAYAFDEAAIDGEIAALAATGKPEPITMQDYHPFPALQPSSLPPPPKPPPGGNCFSGSFSVPCRPSRNRPFD